MAKIAPKLPPLLLAKDLKPAEQKKLGKALEQAGYGALDLEKLPEGSALAGQISNLSKVGAEGRRAIGLQAYYHEPDKGSDSIGLRVQQAASKTAVEVDAPQVKQLLRIFDSGQVTAQLKGNPALNDLAEALASLAAGGIKLS